MMDKHFFDLERKVQPEKTEKRNERLKSLKEPKAFLKIEDMVRSILKSKKTNQPVSSDHSET